MSRGLTLDHADPLEAGAGRHETKPLPGLPACWQYMALSLTMPDRSSLMARVDPTEFISCHCPGSRLDAWDTTAPAALTGHEKLGATLRNIRMQNRAARILFFTSLLLVFLLSPAPSAPVI